MRFLRKSHNCTGEKINFDNEDPAQWGVLGFIKVFKNAFDSFVLLHKFDGFLWSNALNETRMKYMYNDTLINLHYIQTGLVDCRSKLDIIEEINVITMTVASQHNKHKLSR